MLPKETDIWGFLRIGECFPSISQQLNFLQLKDVMTKHQVSKLPQLLRVISLLLLMLWQNLGLRRTNHSVGVNLQHSSVLRMEGQI